MGVNEVFEAVFKLVELVFVVTTFLLKSFDAHTGHLGLTLETLDFSLSHFAELASYWTRLMPIYFLLGDLCGCSWQ